MTNSGLYYVYVKVASICKKAEPNIIHDVTRGKEPNSRIRSLEANFSAAKLMNAVKSYRGFPFNLFLKGSITIRPKACPHRFRALLITANLIKF